MIFHELKIGQVHLGNNLVLAPMAGVSDLPFRLLCHESGAGMVCSEMISAKALIFKNKKTQELLRTIEEERPVSVQIFGSDPDCMAEAAAMIDNDSYDILDINMGCPVNKIVKNGEGSALLGDPVRIGEIVRRVVKATSKPVTVKIRKGIKGSSSNTAEICRIAEDAGAGAIIVHGRTREQLYSGRADYGCIRDAKNAVGIPVIGNGDIDCYESAVNMYEQTGCDGFMIGRAARGNPFIFGQILGADKGLEKEDVTTEELIDTILRHARMQIELKGEYCAIRQMRKHAAWYMAGRKGAAALRASFNYIESYEELSMAFKEYIQNNDH